MNEKKELSEEQIGKIKNLFGGGILGSDLFDEEKRNELRKKRSVSGTNGIIFGKLFLLSYDSFNNNFYKLLDSEEDKKLYEPFQKYLDYYSEDAERLRNLIENYEFGVGTYYIGEEIRKIVNNKRGEKNELINLFFRIFVED